MMYAVVPAEGDVELVEVNSNVVDWQQLRRHVGGYIEAVRIVDGMMYIDENGKSSDKSVNAIATALLWETGRDNDIIVGDVVVFGPSNGPEETSITDDLIDRLAALAVAFNEPSDDALPTWMYRIREDVLRGRIPPSVRSFSELHDFVDANDYIPEEATLEQANVIAERIDVWLQRDDTHAMFEADITHAYVEACNDAVERQGLQPVIEAFARAKIPFDVEQTGGFVMVIVVPMSDGCWAITCEGENNFLLGWYPGDAWQRGELADDGAEFDLATIVDCISTAREAESLSDNNKPNNTNGSAQ